MTMTGPGKLMNVFAVALLAVLALNGCGAPPPGPKVKLPYEPTTAEDLPKVKMTTSQGEIVIELFEDDCPNAVTNFINLAEKGFYNGLTFHRIIPNFCVQGGDPKGDGSGGPGFALPPEFYDDFPKNEFGTIATAKPGGVREQSGSQFFFNVNEAEGGNKHLDGQHIVFGKVVEGLDAVRALAKHPTGSAPKKDEAAKEMQKIIKVEVLNKRSHSYADDQVKRIPKPDELETKKDETGDKKDEVKKGEEKTDKTDKSDDAKGEKKPAADESKTESQDDSKKEAAPAKTKTEAETDKATDKKAADKQPAEKAPAEKKESAPAK